MCRPACRQDGWRRRPHACGLSTERRTTEPLHVADRPARITAIEAIPFTLPYRVPPRFASGSIEAADNVLVRVHTDAGVIGQAEAQPRPYTYGETQASIVETVSGELNAALTGLDPLRVELIASRCAAVAGHYVARGAVDLAVWDLVGQLLGCPCHVLLGGFADDVAAAHMVSFDEPAAMADEATAMSSGSESGPSRSRSASPSLDLAAVRAIRRRCPTPICTSTPIGAGATSTPSRPAINLPSSGCGQSRNRSRSRIEPAACGFRRAMDGAAGRR